jgi:hypothetical protein
MDVIASNFYERPIYFSITCQSSKLLNLDNYTEMEGLGLRVSPTKVRFQSSMPSIYGFGDIDLDKTHEIVTKKWKWGNFDKKPLFVDRSYGAEIQAMKMVMMRAAVTLDGMKNKLKSEKKDTTIVTKQAIDISKKYFEAFPHFNFPYDGSVITFIRVLIRSGAYDEAKKHLRILAKEDAQYMEFYASQTDRQVRNNFRQDEDARISSIQDAILAAKSMNDPSFVKEIETLLAKYNKPDELQQPPLE